MTALIERRALFFLATAAALAPRSHQSSARPAAPKASADPLQPNSWPDPGKPLNDVAAAINSYLNSNPKNRKFVNPIGDNAVAMAASWTSIMKRSAKDDALGPEPAEGYAANEKALAEEIRLLNQSSSISYAARRAKDLQSIAERAGKLADQFAVSGLRGLGHFLVAVAVQNQAYFMLGLDAPASPECIGDTLKTGNAVREKQLTDMKDDLEKRRSSLLPDREIWGNFAKYSLGEVVKSRLGHLDPESETYPCYSVRTVQAIFVGLNKTTGAPIFKFSLSAPVDHSNLIAADPSNFPLNLMFSSILCTAPPETIKDDGTYKIEGVGIIGSGDQAKFKISETGLNLPFAEGAKDVEFDIKALPDHIRTFIDEQLKALPESLVVTFVERERARQSAFAKANVEVDANGVFPNIQTLLDKGEENLGLIATATQIPCSVDRLRRMLSRVGTLFLGH